MRNNNLSVLMLGRLPPPIGGVTISVENLFIALRSKKVDVGFLFSGLSRRYDIAHIHAYDAKKRLLLAILAKVFAKRTVFTIHGMHFDQRCHFNRLVLKLTDGVVILNDNILSHAPELGKLPLLKVSSLVQEGLTHHTAEQKLLPPDKVKPRILLYAQHGNSFEGQPIYGVPFILSMMTQLIERYTVIIVDLSHAYPQLQRFASQDVIHLTSPVDFKQLLTEVDLYLRPTSKDGDSVAIREAVMLNVPVVASDVVERAVGVVTYRHLEQTDCLKQIEHALTAEPADHQNNLSSVSQYIEFYNDLLSS